MIALVLIIISAKIRYRSGEIDYLDSDATWHALYTIECYNETPISQHLFLPIVSMGGEDNKWISWGACIPDDVGNYYYTSFSPAGYFVPWAFMKAFNLPIEEKSLYIFNTFLLSVSALILIYLLWSVYLEYEWKGFLTITAAIAYILSPEILHGMGIVYWSQSIMQVTLLLQILAYYKCFIQKEEKYKCIFYIMTFINPYIEWTGYVANVGFALAEIIRNGKKCRKEGITRSFIIAGLTALSFGLFCLHYLLRTDTVVFFTALKNRFMARNVTTSVLLTDVIGGYLKSFLYLWVAFLVLTIWNIIKTGFIRIENGLLLLVSAFPIIENIVMKQHAIAYTYDRMKAVFVLILLLCELQKGIYETISSKNSRLICVGVIVIASLLNLKSYIKDPAYIWDVDYRTYNAQLAEYVTGKYPDAVYASDSAIRGYMNLLFGRGIYEGQSLDSAIEIARQKGKENVVYIKKDGYKLQPVVVMNIMSDVLYEISNDGNIVEILLGDYVQAAEMTDDNWTNGVSNNSNVILFSRNDNLLIQLLTHDFLVCNNIRMNINDVEFDDLWIRVETNISPDTCQYPSQIYIE